MRQQTTQPGARQSKNHTFRAPALFRRQAVLFPTVWGWLVLLVATSMTAVLLARSLHPFLAMSKSNNGDILVVEGWLPDYALAHAKTQYQSGRYRKILTTGGPLEKGSFLESYGNLAILACSTLYRMGVPDTVVTAVPSPHTRKDRTYATACSVRDWLARNGVASPKIDLMSLGAHSRRSRALFARALGDDVDVGILAIEDLDYDPRQWWRSSAGVRVVVGEALALLYVAILFDPDDV